MRVHYLQHVPFEDLGSMAVYFKEKNARITNTQVYQNTAFPGTNEFDLLVVMGGPMGVYQENEHPWLVTEKAFIRSAVDDGKIVIGFCLGAQLIAEVCGATVTQNGEKEIGWFDCQPVESSAKGILNSIFARSELAFHWHGDTFSLPPGAQRLARSQACENQAFSIDDRIFGFQFHLEVTPAGTRDLIKHCSDELTESRFVQTPALLKGTVDQFMQINTTLRRCLDNILSHHQLH